MRLVVPARAPTLPLVEGEQISLTAAHQSARLCRLEMASDTCNLCCWVHDPSIGPDRIREWVPGRPKPYYACGIPVKLRRRVGRSPGVARRSLTRRAG